LFAQIGNKPFGHISRSGRAPLLGKVTRYRCLGCITKGAVRFAKIAAEAVQLHLRGNDQLHPALLGFGHLLPLGVSRVLSFDFGLPLPLGVCSLLRLKRSQFLPLS